MSANIRRIFRAPYSVPNGIHAAGDTAWIVDQITDRVALVQLGEPNEYGVTRFLREIVTESSNTSGLTFGDGSLWLAANGPGSIWRDLRPTDAVKGDILRVDPTDGRTLARYTVPDGGGVHGIEYDPLEPGILWVTTLKSQTLSKVAIDGWQVVHTIPLPYHRAHGVIRSHDGIWVVYTSERVILKHDLTTGVELARIAIPADQPEPHCLTRDGDDFLYCDATSGAVARIVAPGI